MVSLSNHGGQASARTLRQAQSDILSLRKNNKATLLTWLCCFCETDTTTSVVFYLFLL